MAYQKNGLISKHATVIIKLKKVNVESSTGNIPRAIILQSWI